MRVVLVIILAVTVLMVASLAAAAGHLAAHRMGRLVLLLGVALLPLVLVGAGMATGVHESGHVTFCMGCHEMAPYGRSLFVDNPSSLAAVHYQKRLIPRESTCYACHTDYALFGDAKAKLNGLKHVWVHYFGDVPDRPALYRPYPNYNCLHCHEDARPYREQPQHRSQLSALQAGSPSCLSCHAVAHDLAGVKAENFWHLE